MAKLVLGKTPKTFKPFPVKFTLPDGQEDQITVTFVYKTRSQFAKFMDELFNANSAPTEVTQVGEESPAATPESSKAPDFVDLFEQGGKKTVAHLSKIIADWDFVEKPTPEILGVMHDEAPAAAAAFATAYQDACTSGRLGN